MTDAVETPESLRTSFLGSRWNPDLNGYQNVQAVTFSSDGDLDRAVHCFWNDASLKGVPRVHAGDLTLFMPMEAVDILKEGGIGLSHSQLVDDEAPAKKSAKRKVPALSY